MEKKLKLGIVGFGRIVELIHLRIIKQIDELEICGIYDITEKRRELAVKRGFTVYNTLDELLNSDVELILVATTPNTHFNIAKQALLSDKHVLVEKPITINLKEAESLREYAKEKNKIITVFQNRRFSPDYKLVKKIIKSNTLGDLLFINRRHHMFGSGKSFGVKSFNPDWRINSEFGGGALLDWGIHLIDQLISLNPGKIEKINSNIHSLPGSEGDVEDYVQASLISDKGIILSMDLNFRSNVPEPLWVVGGEKATLYVKSEKEAYILENRKTSELLEMDKISMMDGKEIYRAIIDHLFENGKLSVTIDEAVEGIRILENINMKSGI